MPRRNRRRGTPEPAVFAGLLSELRAEWAVRTGAATWAEVRDRRRAAARGTRSPSTQTTR